MLLWAWPSSAVVLLNFLPVCGNSQGATSSVVQVRLISYFFFRFCYRLLFRHDWMVVHRRFGILKPDVIRVCAQLTDGALMIFLAVEANSSSSCQAFTKKVIDFK